MLTIVVPTYKEALNLEPLARSVDAVMGQHGITYELLIVDDNSPDETAGVARELARDFPVELYQPVGRRRDLSLSVLDGIREARFDNVVVMDADLSHPPERIPEMLAHLGDNDQAFVLGSRYVDGGSFDRNWSAWRFLNSHIATLLARPLAACSDPMSGFFALNRRCLGDLAQYKPLGYKIALELMVRGNFSEIREVPIQFTDRELGTSKMSLGEQLKYLRHLRRLYLYRFGNLAEFVHFGAVGASGMIVDVAFYYAFQFFGMPHQVARAFSFWPAVSWNWVMNRMATFGERKRRPRIRQWLEFVASSLVGFSISWGTYVLLTANVDFLDRYRVLALILGVGAASTFNFTVATLFVYNEKRGLPADDELEVVANPFGDKE